MRPRRRGAAPLQPHEQFAAANFAYALQKEGQMEIFIFLFLLTITVFLKDQKKIYITNFQFPFLMHP